MCLNGLKKNEKVISEAEVVKSIQVQKMEHMEQK